MTYRKRRRSEADIYHVFARGTGRRIIFEDDRDRVEYLRRIDALLSEVEGELNSWCLMGNHVHLVAHMEMGVLSSFVKRLNGGYARFFNGRHGRSGHLFESRFGSEPVRTDEQFLAAVRYVHRNPVKAGLSPDCDYPWSSFHEYTGIPRLVDTRQALELLGGLPAFLEFHEDWAGDDRFLDEPDNEQERYAQPGQSRFTVDEAVELAKSLLGAADYENIAALPVGRRDEHLAALHGAGLSIRQIELITGVDRNVVWLAGCKPANGA